MAQNIERHKRFVETAVTHHADLLLFPELSLTGYEPTLAQELAIPPTDPRLDKFQTLADGELCAGGTAVWNANGQRLAQLDDHTEGLLIYDTKSDTILCLAQ